MRRVKGCINKACVANQKKITFNESDDYCTKCGNKLYYVCRECYTQLPDDSEKYCVRCLAEKHDRKDHTLKAGGTVLTVGGAVLAVGGAAVRVGKMVIKAISKFK